MISRQWVDPNVKFTAKDYKDTEEHICYTTDKNALRQLLVARGYTDILIIDYDFSEWRTRAATARDKAVWQRIEDRWSYFQQQARDRWTWLDDNAIAAVNGSKKELVARIQKHDNCTREQATAQVDLWSGGLEEETPALGQMLPKTAITFNRDIWKELKWHLFDLFQGKCAYCEHKPLAGASGDVEHYRPKGKVDEDENHPGYYWLAYDEHNLLPSCELCNRPGRAKLTHFPVIGAHSRDARKVAAEQPLLLNPYDQQIDLFQHLEFDAAGSSLSHNASQYGEKSRTIYDLDRGYLKEARFQAMQQIEVDWRTHVNLKTSIRDAYLELHQQITRGDREYSAALLWELDRVRSRTIQELTAMPGLSSPAGNST